MPLSLADYMQPPAVSVDIRPLQSARSKREWEERRNELREYSKQLIAGATRLVAAAEADIEMTAAGVEELIEQLREIEVRQGQKLAESRGILENLRALPRPNDPEMAEQLGWVIAVSEEALELSINVVETTRDARWALATILSTHEEHGDGPVVSTVEQFDRLYARR